MDAVLNAVAISSDDPRMLIDPKALQAFLRVRLSCANLEVCDFRQALGGRSRQTALFKLNNANGGADDLVVQRSLPGLEPGPEFASVAGQFEVLKRLHDAGMKVPKPLCFDAGTKDLGSPFLIVERSHGSVVEPDYWAVPKSPAIAMQLAEQMALLHSQPIGDLNTLIRKSRERSDRQGWLDELNRLAQEWNTLAHWPSVTASAAIAWMRANIDCIEDRQTLVHNDMVFHNVLGEGDRLTATLDWEQISIGHPAEDLGYCYPVVAAAVDWESFLDAYYKAGGPSISKRQIDYFALRGVLRLMIMVLNGGRNAFENNLSDDVLVASAGAYFSQRLLRRFAQVLEAVLDRK
jgi:aminoglycoside phosphotransferase (APT) family kinase protein